MNRVLTCKKDTDKKMFFLRIGQLDATNTEMNFMLGR